MGSKSTTGLNLLFLFLPKAKYKTYQMHFQYYWLLNLSFRYFRACFRYFREYRFSFILTFIKKPLEIKAVSSKHVIPSLYWKQSTKSVFSYCCEWEGYTFTTKIIKITRFQPKPQLATMLNCYFKKHLFFLSSFKSYFSRSYCWLQYLVSLWISLLSSVCACTFKFTFPSLPKLAY